MKIVFGYENNGPIDRVSPELQQKGINLLKSVPSEFPAIGLVRYPQLGFASYRSNLPAFMFANDVGKRVPLLAEGYPIRISVERCIPLKLPKIGVAFHKVPEGFGRIKEQTLVEDVSVKGKGSGFIVTPKVGLLGRLLKLEPDLSYYSPIGSVGVGEYTSLVTILRILSSFLSVHTYPAYSTPEDYQPLEDQAETTKRSHSELSKEYGGVSLSAKRRVIEENGIATIVHVDAEDAMSEVVLNFAKPQKSSNAPWGMISSIPNTHGIVFPFVPELASWDKDTLPGLLERYFIRCLGTSTNQCLHSFSKVSADWKKSIHRTDIGNAISHMAKVISISLTSEARTFPIIEDGIYSGCYLSGANFSIGLRGTLVQPVSYEDNKDDFSIMDSHQTTLVTLLNQVQADGIAPQDVIDNCTTMRRLDHYIETNFTADEEDLALVKRLRFPGGYLPINIDTIEQFVGWIILDEIPDTVPMHHSAFGSKDLIKSALSAFGPAPPSPLIPGAPKVKFAGKVPADKDLPRLLVFRKCALDIAVADWKEVLETGTTSNDPRTLNARYQNVKVTGNEDKKRWFKAMRKLHDHIVSQSKNQDIEAPRGNVDVGGDDDEGVGLGGF